MSETDGPQGCVKVSGHRRVALRCERVKRGTEEARPAHEHFRSVQPSLPSGTWGRDLTIALPGRSGL